LDVFDTFYIHICVKHFGMANIKLIVVGLEPATSVRILDPNY